MNLDSDKLIGQITPVSFATSRLTARGFVYFLGFLGVAGSGLLAGATAIAIYTAGPQLWLNGTVAPAQWRMYEVAHGGMAVAGVVSLLALVIVVGLYLTWLLSPNEPALVLSAEGVDGGRGC